MNALHWVGGLLCVGLLSVGSLGAAERREGGVQVDVGRGQGVSVDVDVKRDKPRDAATTQHLSKEAKTGLAFRSKDIIGMDVFNHHNDDLGDINDLVVDLRDGKVHYAILSFGGWLGMGDKLFAVPWNHFSVKNKVGDTDNWFALLAIDKEKLRTAPGYDKNNWPDLTSDRWIHENREFYSRFDTGKTAETRDARAGEKLTLFRLSKLDGMDVKDRNREDSGEIKDVVVDINTGKIRYVAVSFGGWLGMGDKLFAMPWNALKMYQTIDDPNDRYFVLQLDRSTLKNAPGFDKENWPAFASEHWQNIDKFYGGDRSAERPGTTRQ